MQLKKIQEHIAAYKKWLKNGSQDTETNLYKWESQQIWQKNWDIEATDFAEMLDQSLQNSTSRRIWSRENYAPKKAMLEFMKMQPHFVYSMFQELFNEEKDIRNRIDRFIFYCDELMKEYKTINWASVKTNHYHDYDIISHYLAFQYPDRYTPYRFLLFKNTLEKIGGKDIPTSNDVTRYFKIMKTLYQFLSKDEELMSLHQKRLEDKHFQGTSLLLVEDFADFLLQ